MFHRPPNGSTGELSFNQIKSIKIEDLLERDPIKLDHDVINSKLNAKTILITGAAGSIGSELARQCLRFNPSKIYLYVNPGRNTAARPRPGVF